MLNLVSFITLLVSFYSISGSTTIYVIKKGTISFISEAQLETIKAASTQAKGLIQLSDNTFAFTVPNHSFHGFNSALQEEHFNENYMHSDRFPNSTFSGKIIEAVHLNVPGEYNVRAKGMLDIHGVKQERIIKCKINVGENEINLVSGFTVLLEDHKINVPRIVNDKIFPEIKVNVNFTLHPK
jgi:hypothetical protein